MTHRLHSSGLLLPADFAEPAPDLREIASTRDGRDITRGYVTPMAQLAPQDTILQARGGGDWAIYQQVKSDPQVGATLQQRRLAVTKTEWEVTPGGTRRIDQRAAELLKQTLDRIRWDAVTAAMHWGVFYGWAVAECLWSREGERVVLDAVRVRDRTRFVFDGAGRLRLKTLANAEGEILPERKFWTFATGADHDDEPYGLGLAHWLYWPVLFKRANIKFWLIAAEKFGSPTALGVFPPGATATEQQKLLTTLQAIQTDAGVILPEGMTIDLLETKRTGGADYAALCDYMDAAIAKLTLGQVMTSEAVGGQYKAEVQDGVKDDLVKSDADLLCDSFNRGPVRWLVDFNYPGAAYPKVWRRVDDDNDIPPDALNAYAMGVERLARLMPIPARHIYEITKIPEPSGEEALLTPPTAPTQAGGLQSGSLDADPPAFAESDGEGAQALIDAEGERDPGWGQVMDELLAPLFSALAEGQAPEQILARMDEWYPAMDDGALVDLLTRAIAAAEASGRLEVGGRA